MSFFVRHAVADDVPAIADIAIAAYSGDVAAIGREPAPMSADFAAHLAAWSAQCRRGNICCFCRQIKPVNLPLHRCVQGRKCL